MAAGATSYFGIGTGGALLASYGNDKLDCTVGAGPGTHCLNNDAMPACTADGDCNNFGASVSQSCARDANCFFGPPVELPNPFISANSICLVNVVESDASGTIAPAGGDIAVMLPLSSRVYLTGDLGSPCPHCVTGSCTYGVRSGLGCTTTGSTGTSIDCLPGSGGNGGQFYGVLAVDLNPLTTDVSTLTDAAGNFCASQGHAGAFGVAAARRILEHGAPAGDLTGGTANPASLASALCVPGIGNEAIDAFIDLSGPGGLSLDGTAQIVPTP